MARIAIVTGGTRGIGAAISVALKDRGCTVAANYGGKDAAANAFKEETGIHVFKWDVGDFQACQDGVARVEADLGPVDILVNNAGITRDATLHRMTPEQWDDVIRVDLSSCFYSRVCAELDPSVGAYALHQIVQKLRSGTIHTHQLGRVEPDKILLAGESLGGNLVWIEAATYHDVDGLVGHAHELEIVRPASRPALRHQRDGATG